MMPTANGLRALPTARSIEEGGDNRKQDEPLPGYGSVAPGIPGGGKRENTQTYATGAAISIGCCAFVLCAPASRQHKEH